MEEERERGERSFFAPYFCKKKKKILIETEKTTLKE
jgi:hypothetical protein